MNIPTFLKKGEKFSLTKAAGPAGLSRIKIRLGWDVRGTAENPFQMYSSARLLYEFCTIEVHSGLRSCQDNSEAFEDRYERLARIGQRDQSVLDLNLEKVAIAGVKRVAITVTVHEAQKRNHCIGGATNTYVRIANAADGNELVDYEIFPAASSCEAMIFADLYNDDGQWMVHATGHAFDGSDKSLREYYGCARY